MLTELVASHREKLARPWRSPLRLEKFLQRFSRKVTKLAGQEAQIRDGLAKAVRDGDWAAQWLWLIAADAHPDPRYVPSLIALLEVADPESRNEDAVELLADLGDPRALPVLFATARIRNPNDPARSLPRKAHEAICAIGGPEARAFLERAAEDEDLEIRTSAREWLTGWESAEAE